MQWPGEKCGLVKIGLIESGHSPDDRDSEYFKRTYREQIYEALFDIARENLPYHDVVIVWTFTKEIQDTGWLAKLSSKLGGPVEVHYVQCLPEVRRERIANRGDACDLAKLENWDRYIKYYGDEPPPVFEHVLVYGVSTE
jgi:hypothetical protein